MIRESTALRVTALTVLLSACGVDPGAPLRAEPGDAQLFASYVQPYLTVECASLDCHGVGGRPLRLYSELGLRRDSVLRTEPVADERDPTPITAPELADNQLALAALAAGAQPPSAQLTLRKPLALDAGGFEHEGGVHWSSTSDPGYRCLRGYLLGDVEDPAAACAEALAAVMP